MIAYISQDYTVILFSDIISSIKTLVNKDVSMIICQYIVENIIVIAKDVYEHNVAGHELPSIIGISTSYESITPHHLLEKLKINDENRCMCYAYDSKEIWYQRHFYSYELSLSCIKDDDINTWLSHTCHECGIFKDYCQCLETTCSNCICKLTDKCDYTFLPGMPDNIRYHPIKSNGHLFITDLALDITKMAGKCNGFAFGGFVRDLIVQGKYFSDLDLCFKSEKYVQHFLNMCKKSNRIQPKIGDWRDVHELLQDKTHNKYGKKGMHLSVKRNFCSLYLKVDIVILSPNDILELDFNVNSLLYDGKVITTADCNTLHTQEIINEIHNHEIKPESTFIHTVRFGKDDEKRKAQERIKRMIDYCRQGNHNNNTIENLIIPWRFIFPKHTTREEQINFLSMDPSLYSLYSL
jgi:hypothetical protein